MQKIESLTSASPGAASVLHPVLVELLLQRKTPPEKIPHILSWNLKELPDITQILDLDKASERLIQAITENEIIAVYGDYDVDGTTSCALLYHFFKSLGVAIKLYQPGRFIEGYGLHVSSIDEALRDGVKVLITVDCGITSYEAAVAAKARNLDLIITDHHTDMLPELPPAYAVVNPNRRDEPVGSDLRRLAGVGVAFALAWEIKKRLEKNGHVVPGLYPLLQFVAIGTLADLAELNPMNLKLVRHGLKQIPRSEFPGIKTFLSEEERALDCLPGDKVSFQIGPLINSKGRMDHPEKSLKLLTAANLEEARECFYHLEEANRQRKITQAQVYEEAKEQILKGLFGEEPLIHICYAPHWHEGVVGIVASKLVETFGVPAIVLTDAPEAGLIKGSARSAGELSIFDALNVVHPLFKKFGGHRAAAGLTMEKKNLPLLREEMNRYLKEIPVGLRTEENVYDLWVSPEQVVPKLARDLEVLGPFGQGHEAPVFRMKGVQLESFQVLKEAHVKWFFKEPKTGLKLTGISFYFLGKWGQTHPKDIFERQHEEELSIQFSVNINRYRGKEFLQLFVDKISLG